MSDGPCWWRSTVFFPNVLLSATQFHLLPHFPVCPPCAWHRAHLWGSLSDWALAYGADALVGSTDMEQVVTWWRSWGCVGRKVCLRHPDHLEMCHGVMSLRDTGPACGSLASPPCPTPSALTASLRSRLPQTFLWCPPAISNPSLPRGFTSDRRPFQTPAVCQAPSELQQPSGQSVPTPRSVQPSQGSWQVPGQTPAAIFSRP